MRSSLPRRLRRGTSLGGPKTPAIIHLFEFGGRTALKSGGTSAWGALREVAQVAANGAMWVYFVGACLGFLPVLLVFLPFTNSA